MELSELTQQHWVMILMVTVNVFVIGFIGHYLYQLQQRLVKVNPFLDALNDQDLPSTDLDSLMLEERLAYVEKVIKSLQKKPQETVAAASQNVAYADAMGLARQGANISDISKQCYLSSSEAQLIKRMQAHESVSA